jgi:hypothetical protein
MARRCVGVRIAILISALLLALVATAPVAAYFGGSEGLLAAGTAMAICLLGGILALVLDHLLASFGLAPYSVLIGMIPRMGLPLGLCAIVYVVGGVLARAGLAYYLLVFYPLMLLVETLLVVPKIESAKAH